MIILVSLDIDDLEQNLRTGRFIGHCIQAGLRLVVIGDFGKRTEGTHLIATTKVGLGLLQVLLPLTGIQHMCHGQIDLAQETGYGSLAGMAFVSLGREVGQTALLQAETKILHNQSVDVRLRNTNRMFSNLGRSREIAVNQRSIPPLADDIKIDQGTHKTGLCQVVEASRFVSKADCLGSQDGKVTVVDRLEEGIPVTLQIGVAGQQREVRKLEGFSGSRLVVQTARIVGTFFGIGRTTFAQAIVGTKGLIGTIDSPLHIVGRREIGGHRNGIRILFRQEVRTS